MTPHTDACVASIHATLSPNATRVRDWIVRHLNLVGSCAGSGRCSAMVGGLETYLCERHAEQVARMKAKRGL